tara:strand:- start:192 stop:695 length:504 start_codon:yes stop_codon:yes gene_type:complete
MKKLIRGQGDNRNSSILWMKLMPNRSLSSEGTLVVFIILAIGLVIPIIPFLGSEIGITLTLFSGFTFYLFLFFLGKSFQSGQLYEEIWISSEKIEITHKEKNKKKLTWEGNPFWTKVIMEDKVNKVENYLTIREKGRHIELGAFLSPEERIDLKSEIQNALAKAKLT